MNKRFFTSTNILIAINITVMLMLLSVNFINHKEFELQLDTLVNFGAIVPHQSSLLTIISGMFLHGGLFHIASNMLTLKIFGNKMEKLFGQLFVPFYFLSGIISGLIVYFFSNSVTVGASGAICGLWGAQLFYTLKYSSIRLDKVAMLIDTIILLGIGFLPNISAIGHLSGLMTGLIIGAIYFPNLYQEKNYDDLNVSIN